uniref:Uncharacterized protein n=1 Tax=viral metagenome TaxID=1070528 RepID=A0A6M3L5D4_9ZZZZ
MDKDTDILQPDASTGAAEGEVIQTEATEEQPPAPEFVTKSEFQKALDERLEQSTRHWQSVVDKQVAEARRETQKATDYARSLESRVQFTEQQAFSQLDPEEQWKRRIEMQLAQSRAPQQPQYPPELISELQEANIEVSDPRIDWATGERNPVAGSRRFLKSIERIKAENAKTSEVKKEEPPKPPPLTVPVETGPKGKAARRWTKDAITDLSPSQFKALSKEDRAEMNKAISELSK